MRVTDKAIFDTAARSSLTLRDRVQKAVAENSTGLRVEHPWDDPGVTAPLIGSRLAVTRQEALVTTSERANDELLATDVALNGLTETLSRARELALQLSNDSYSGTDRTVAAEEVRSLFKNAIGVLNTRVGNRYIFAGFQDDQPAFDGTGLYQGDSGVRQIEAFPGSMTTVSIPGDEVATGANGGPDILESLRTLETSLTSNDVATLRGTLTMFDDGIEHLSLARAKLGASSNNLIAAIDTARGNVMTEKANVSRLAEVDVIESASRLALAQRALEAALTASARSFDLSLLHKLG